MYACIWKKEVPYYGTGMEVRGQFRGVSFLFLPHGLWNPTWVLKLGSERLHSPELSCRLLHMGMVMFICSSGDLFCS